MKKMSKILSIILAISMVISMIPMSFAAEGETEATDAGVTVTYPFSTKLADEVYAGRLSAITELKYTTKESFGRIEWHSTTSTVSGGMAFGSYAFSANIKTGEYFAYKIRVPAAGKYTINQKYAYKVYSDANGNKVKNMYGNMYILDADTADIKSALKDENRVMQIDFIDKDEKGALKGTSTDAATLKGNSAPAMTATWIAPTAGEYIIAWDGEGETNSLSRYVVTLGDLTLDGNGTNRALIYADLTGTKTELDAAIGEETDVVLNSVYMSDGVAATAAEKEAITYESSNDNIATITADNKIKAVSEGTATIYAKSGDYVLGEVEVTVTKTPDAGVTVVYPMLKNVYDAYGTINPSQITYENQASAQRIEWDDFTGTLRDAPEPSWSQWAVSMWFKKQNTEPQTEYGSYTIRIPKSGKYNITLIYAKGTSGTSGEMYIAPKNKETVTTEDVLSIFETEKPVMTVDFYGKTRTEYTEFENYYKAVNGATVPTQTASKVFEEGEYLVIWRGTGEANSSGRYLLLPATMILNGGDGLAIMDLAISAPDKTLSVDEPTTVTATGTLSNTGLQKDVGGAAKFTYSSSNPDVATVDETTGEVTAVSGGVAKITATCTNPNVIDGYKTISTFIAVNEPTTTVSFGFDSEVDGITITSDYTQGEVVSIPRGEEIEVSAPATAEIGDKTYVFRGWVRGSADEGRLISLESTYSFTAMTNTYLTAIYTEAANEEYYAWNGEFLGTTKPEAEPTVLGYSFKEWAKSVASETLTRFVAQYEQLSTTYDVKYNGNTTKHKYDDPVTLSSDKNVYWYRDGKLVDYGKSYTFNVWDKTEVTTSNEGHDLPKIILDDQVKDNTYMVEYDAAEKTIIEVGILFNEENDGAPTVTSCKEKMNSQRNLSENTHGQFAAKADMYTNARGYLIYQDGDSYKVIYSE